MVVADTSEAEVSRAEVASEQLEAASAAHASRSLPDTSLTFGRGTPSLQVRYISLT